MAERCDAKSLATGRKCGRAEGVRAVRQGCVHEHVIDRHLCASHIRRTDRGYCGECLDAGHDCPILIQVRAVTP